MRFDHRFATTVDDAVGSGARHTSAREAATAVDFIAGGTDMLQLLQDRLRDTRHLIDLSRLPGLDEITIAADEARLGALVRMSDAAAHPVMRTRFPVIVEALEASASAQLTSRFRLG